MYDNLMRELPIYGVFEGLNKNASKSFAETRALTNDAASLQTFVEKLRTLIGKHGAPFSTAVGTHPNFAHLRNGQQAYTSTTSLFLDIKGSTQLFDKYPVEQACKMQDAIIQSAIYLIQAFDGHVVRIPGDGIFAVFGRDAYPTHCAILDALNSATAVLLVLESHLEQWFTDNGFKPIRIRIGIDHEPKALWRHNGIAGCNEMSPHGLHVSLACKLQNRADLNTIMIGNNIKEMLQLPDDQLTRVKKDSANQAERFIRGDYKMWVFQWENHAKTFSWVTKTSSGLLPVVSDQPTFKINAALQDENGNIISKLHSSMVVLDKGHSIIFTVSQLPENSKIRWIVENTGTEASNARDLTYEMESERNQKTVTRSTAYHGVHTMICKVTYPSGKAAEQRFVVIISGSHIGEQIRDVTNTGPQLTINSRPLLEITNGR